MKKKKEVIKKKTKIITKKEKVFSSRVKTGIKNLDLLCEGGLKKNSTNLIVGGSGNGKTIMAMQFLIGGIKLGEKALYVTFEEKKEQFYENMKRFGWNLEEYEKKGLFFFLEYTPIKVKTMLEEGGGSIENIIVKEKISRLAIDSMTSFALLFDKESKKREAALELFNIIKKWNCTCIVTLEEDAGTYKRASSQAIEFESDSIILLYFVRSKGKRERYIEILKMRGTNHSKNMYGFSIEKSGVEISKKPNKTNIII